MLLTARATEGVKELFLFDAVIPIVSGIWASSAVLTYRTDNKEAGIHITKLNTVLHLGSLDTGPKFARTNIA
jgi:hypothetical protein